MSISAKDLSKMIDHSLLHPTLSEGDLLKGYEVAKRYDVASVCVKPYCVSSAYKVLKDSDVKIGTVVGFPHGSSKIAIKVEETKIACIDGAVEIDMVINIGKALSGEFDYIENEIEAINNQAKSRGAIVKVIFENDYLNEATIIKLCEICNKVGVSYVKTSSGYGFVKQENGMYSYSGATSSDLKLMRSNTDSCIGVKAAGGIRILEDLLYVRTLGVTRVGATATSSILDRAIQLIKSGEALEKYTPNSLSNTLGY